MMKARFFKKVSLLSLAALAAALPVRTSARDADDLILRLDFENQRDLTAIDASGRKNHCATNSAFERAPGRFGQAARFARKGLVRCRLDPAVDFSGGLTLALWAKTDARPKRETLLVGAADLSWGLVHKSGYAYFFGPGKVARCQAPIPAGQWVHLAATYERGHARVYVNGALYDDQTAETDVPLAEVSEIWIGRGKGGSKTGYTGLLDNVEVARGVAAPGRILSLAGRRPETIAISEARRRAADEFFQNQREGAVGFRESGRQLWLANDKVGLEFVVGDGGFYLSRLVDPATRTDFLNAEWALSSENLWGLTLRRDNGADLEGWELGPRVSTAAELKHRVERGDNGAATLRLEWKGLPLPGEPGVVDVAVDVALKPGDPLARWRVRVDNRSEVYGLWRVTFPIVELAAFDEDLASQTFTVPRSRGIIARDCFRQRFYSSAEYPQRVNMQFNSVTGASRRGLYLAALDGDAAWKFFRHETNPARQSILYSCASRPADMGLPGVGYESSFDFVIGPFRGDWYDAAQTYRRWAVRQRWCVKGPMATRADTPRWFKDCGIVLKGQSAGKPELQEECFRRLEAFGAVAPTPVAVMYYMWGEFRPGMTAFAGEGSPHLRVDEATGKATVRNTATTHNGNYPEIPALPGFAEAVARAREVGVHVCPYLGSHIHDPGLNGKAPYAATLEPFAARDEFGRIVPGYADRAWTMCYMTDAWRRRLSRSATLLATNENAGGLYFDTFYGGHFQCFDRSHGHIHGGGDLNHRGARALATAVRDALKAANPDAIMIGECPGEPAISMLDGFLYRYIIRPESGPLLASVYNDYIRRHGRLIDPRKPGFRVQCASLLTEGAQLGRYPIHYSGMNEESSPGFDARHAFFLDLARYYRPEVGGRYLTFGRLLRPVVFTSPDPMPTVSNVGPSYGWTIERPALMAGAFQAPDGAIGLFVVNVTAEPLDFGLELKPSYYPIDLHATYAIASVDKDGKRTSKARQRGAIALQETVGGHNVCFLVIRPTP